MPVYEFRCAECSQIFSELRKMGDVKPGKCPFCGSDKNEKIMSSFSSRSSGSAHGSCAPSGGG